MLDSIGDNTFTYCYTLSSITLPEGLLSIGKGAFAQNTERVQSYYQMTGGKKSYSALKSLKLPASLKTIGEAAFENCDALTKVTFDKRAQVEEIGEGAFAMCLKLKEISVPGSVKHIGDDAFVNCLALKTASLGEGVEQVGKELFMYCRSMTGLTLPDSLTEIGEKFLEGHGDKLKVTCGAGSAAETWLKTNYSDVTVVYPKKQ